MLKIAHEYHPSLIGQGGKYVVRLEEKYDVKITFPRGEHSEVKPRETLKPDEVHIRGPKKGVANAKAELLEVSSRMSRVFVIVDLRVMRRRTSSRSPATSSRSSPSPHALSLEFLVAVVLRLRRSRRTPALSSTLTSLLTIVASLVLFCTVPRKLSLTLKRLSWISRTRSMKKLPTA